MVIEVKTFNSSNEVLSNLDPTNKYWSKWIFRGQPSSAFHLIPSIWREEYKDKFAKFSKLVPRNYIDEKVRENIQQKKYSLKDEEIKNIVTWYLFIKFEDYMLSRFYRVANNSGLKIDENSLRYLNSYSDSFWLSKEFPPSAPENYVYGYCQSGEHIKYGSPLTFEPSLPQHHGLPTRILDWTTHPWKSVFFAAYSYLTNSDRLNDNTETVSVYAFKQNDCNNQGSNPVFIQDNYLRNENWFMHCQDGCFTKIYGEFFFFKHGYWPSIDELYSETKGRYFSIKKFNFSINLLKDILERLDKSGISISTLMPDYNHTAMRVHCDLNLLLL